ncbi:hypothetical protein ACJ5NV_00005, partial [Loktanella agnita]|uniref:hypothetical protein n=1 Tax=Loktanella agnita TaxID=287097 RepID=UPI0039864CD0
MTLKEQLEDRVRSVLSSQWSYAEARVVPETKSIGLGNHGKKLSATILYADLDDSTNLVALLPNLLPLRARVFRRFALLPNLLP